MKNQIIYKDFDKSHDFCQSIRQFLSIKFPDTSIEDLHNLFSDRLFDNKTDQASLVHKSIYSSFDSEGANSTILYTYYELCKEWLQYLQDIYGINEWAIQRFPSIRVQYPNNISVFEFHRDSDYSHPLGELNHFFSNLQY